MHKNMTIQNLSEELSIARLALAQLICNYERRNGYKSWLEIARSWLGYAAQMPEREWLAGTSALLHYLRLLKTKSAIEATDLLNSSMSNYKLNKQRFRGIYRSRGGKSEETYKIGHERLLEQFLELSHQHPGIDLHGGTRGTFARIGELLRACKSRLDGVRK